MKPDWLPWQRIVALVYCVAAILINKWNLPFIDIPADDKGLTVICLGLGALTLSSMPDSGSVVMPKDSAKFDLSRRRKSISVLIASTVAVATGFVITSFRTGEMKNPFDSYLLVAIVFWSIWWFIPRSSRN